MATAGAAGFKTWSTFVHRPMFTDQGLATTYV